MPIEVFGPDNGFDEYGKQRLSYSKEEKEEYDFDLNYLKEGRLHQKKKLRIRIDEFTDIILIQNRGYVGDIVLPSGKFLLKPGPKKGMGCDPLKLLEYVRGFECNDKKRMFYYDTELRPPTPKGSAFFDFLGHIFLENLDDILKKGLLREYVKKEENLNFLKGKLLIHKQIRSNIWTPKFQCRYHDLTVDNPHNRMILYACNCLIDLVSVKSLRADLSHKVEDLRNAVTLLPSLSPSEVTNIAVSRKAPYYDTITDLSKIVIQKAFYQHKGAHQKGGYNYLIDMQVLFERFVYKLFTEILNELDQGSFTLQDQRHYRSGEFIKTPNERGELKLIPDITVLRHGKYTSVIDSKYKNEDRISNSDLYQLCIYSLYLRNTKGPDFKSGVIINSKESGNIEIRKGWINLNKYLNEDKTPEPNISLYKLTLNMNKDIDDIKAELLRNIRDGGEHWKDLWVDLQKSSQPLNPSRQAP